VLTKFDKDQYQILLRQLDALKQTASVLEYQTEFEKLAHGVLMYNPAFNDMFFVTRFVGGLHEDIRSPILLHRPRDVDTASTLAMIQEQELEHTKSSGRDFTRVSSKGAAHVDKQKQQEAGQLGKMLKPETDDKMAKQGCENLAKQYVSSKSLVGCSQV
jgi:hypothetical protein